MNLKIYVRTALRTIYTKIHFALFHEWGPIYLTRLIPPVTIVTVKKVFIYKALKTLLTDVLVPFLQIWKNIKGLN